MIDMNSLLHIHLANITYNCQNYFQKGFGSASQNPPTKIWIWSFYLLINSLPTNKLTGLSLLFLRAFLIRLFTFPISIYWFIKGDRLFSAFKLPLRSKGTVGFSLLCKLPVISVFLCNRFRKYLLIWFHFGYLGTHVLNTFLDVNRKK